MSIGYDRGLEIVGKLEAEGIAATIDPRSATPPCVLGTPPNREYDIACGYTAAWSWFAIVPGPGNADAFKALDELADRIAGVLPVRTMTFTQYAISADSSPNPAYRINFEEGIS